MSKPYKLHERTAKFCKEFVVDFNGTQAAIRAGYSLKAAKVQASRLLTKDNVQAEISRLKQELALREPDLRQQVIDELKKLALSDVNDFLGDDNEILDLQYIDKKKTACISGISTTTIDTEFGTKTNKKLTLWPKDKALEMLGKHLGIFELDNQQSRPAIQVNIEK